MLKIVSVANKCIIIAFLLSLVFVVSLQVFARVFLPQAPSWTEELSRFIMIYLVAVSAGITFKKNLFVNVDLIFHTGKIGQKLLQAVQIVTQIVIFISMSTMAIYSYQIIKIGFSQTSPALLLPMYIIFFTMLLIPLGIVMVQCYNVYTYIYNKIKR